MRGKVSNIEALNKSSFFEFLKFKKTVFLYSGSNGGGTEDGKFYFFYFDGES